MKLEEVNQGNLAIKLALQLDLDFGHHQRRCTQIEDVLVQADLLHSQRFCPHLDDDAFDFIARAFVDGTARARRLVSD